MFRKLSIPLQNRFLFEYKDLMTTFKDDNEKAENHREALEDPNLYEYHSIKGRKEDDDHKTKTPQTSMRSQTHHMANPTMPDRQCQVAIIQTGNSSTSVMGKGS